MEKEIMDNIDHLYRGHILTLILFLFLGLVAVLIAVGAIRFGLIKPGVPRILLMSAVGLCFVFLLIIPTVELLPVRADYKESSYIVLEHATMTVTSESSGGLDRINHVIVTDKDGNRYHLKLQSDYRLGKGDSYTGTIAYLKHSDFVIWYDMDK